jgi:hypothetical protein
MGNRRPRRRRLSVLANGRENLDRGEVQARERGHDVDPRAVPRVGVTQDDHEAAATVLDRGPVERAPVAGEEAKQGRVPVARGSVKGGEERRHVSPGSAI